MEYTKKSWCQPRLVEHGNLARITQEPPANGKTPSCTDGFGHAQTNGHPKFCSL